MPFLLFSQRTARGAERSPTDLVESKARPQKKKEKKRKKNGKKERESARDWKGLIYTALQFRSMDRFSSREGLLLLNAIYIHNLTIKCGANGSDPAPAARSLLLRVYLTECLL